ncbi:hypothetical protein, partial [Brasilonema octagenarum]|uniref:hypothetical protein n=1 Tax=Brasilonema octagenarum TaxID=417105 RepID=UPI001B7CE921
MRKNGHHQTFTRLLSVKRSLLYLPTSLRTGRACAFSVSTIGWGLNSNTFDSDFWLGDLVRPVLHREVPCGASTAGGFPS